MIRRPPRSALLSLHDALPICGEVDLAEGPVAEEEAVPVSRREGGVLVAHDAGRRAAASVGERLGHIEKVRRLPPELAVDRQSTRLNPSHAHISYALFCL